MSGKGAKKGEAEPAGEEEDAPAVDPVKQELLIAQTTIEALNERVATLELENKRLTVSYTAVRDEYETYKGNQADIYEYLSQTINGQKGTITSLEGRVQELSDTKERLEAEIAKNDADAEAKFSSMKGDLEQELRKLRSHVIQVERWQKAMDLSLMQIEDLTNQLDRLKRTSTETARSLERQIVMEREAHKRHLEHMQSEAEKAAYVKARNQLKGTTKRTIIQNEKMATELEYQGIQTQKVLVVNKRLAGEIATLRQYLELSSQTEAESASKLSVLQTVVKRLNAALTDARVAASQREGRLRADIEAAKTANERTRRERAHAEERAAAAGRRADAAHAQLADLRRRHDDLAREYAYFEDVQDETVAFLTQYADELRRESETQPPGECVRAPRARAAAADAQRRRRRRRVRHPLPHPAQFAHMSSDMRKRVVDHLVARVAAFREHVKYLAERDAAERRDGGSAVPRGDRSGVGGVRLRDTAAAFAKAAVAAQTGPETRRAAGSTPLVASKHRPSQRRRASRRVKGSRMPAGPLWGGGGVGVGVAERFASGSVAHSLEIWRSSEGGGAAESAARAAADDDEAAAPPALGAGASAGSGMFPPIHDSLASLHARLPPGTRDALADDPWGGEAQ